jgi:hypothetical protein
VSTAMKCIPIAVSARLLRYSRHTSLLRRNGLLRGDCLYDMHRIVEYLSRFKNEAQRRHRRTIQLYSNQILFLKSRSVSHVLGVQAPQKRHGLL